VASFASPHGSSVTSAGIATSGPSAHDARVQELTRLLRLEEARRIQVEHALKLKADSGDRGAMVEVLKLELQNRTEATSDLQVQLDQVKRNSQATIATLFQQAAAADEKAARATLFEQEARMERATRVELEKRLSAADALVATAQLDLATVREIGEGNAREVADLRAKLDAATAAVRQHDDVTERMRSTSIEAAAESQRQTHRLQYRVEELEAELKHKEELLVEAKSVSAASAVDETRVSRTDFEALQQQFNALQQRAADDAEALRLMTLQRDDALAAAASAAATAAASAIPPLREAPTESPEYKAQLRRANDLQQQLQSLSDEMSSAVAARDQHIATLEAEAAAATSRHVAELEQLRATLADADATAAASAASATISAETAELVAVASQQKAEALALAESEKRRAEEAVAAAAEARQHVVEVESQLIHIRAESVEHQRLFEAAAAVRDAELSAARGYCSDLEARLAEATQNSTTTADALRSQLAAADASVVSLQAEAAERRAQLLALTGQLESSLEATAAETQKTCDAVARADMLQRELDDTRNAITSLEATARSGNVQAADEVAASLQARADAEERLAATSGALEQAHEQVAALTSQLDAASAKDAAEVLQLRQQLSAAAAEHSRLQEHYEARVADLERRLQQTIEDASVQATAAAEASAAGPVAALATANAKVEELHAALAVSADDANAQATALRERLEMLDAELHQTREAHAARIAELETEARDAEASAHDRLTAAVVAAAADAAEKLEAQIADLTAKLSASDDQCRAATEQLAALQDRLAAQTTEADEMRQTFSAQLARAAEHGDATAADATLALDAATAKNLELAAALAAATEAAAAESALLLGKLNAHDVQMAQMREAHAAELVVAETARQHAVAEAEAAAAALQQHQQHAGATIEGLQAALGRITAERDELLAAQAANETDVAAQLRVARNVADAALQEAAAARAALAERSATVSELQTLLEDAAASATGETTALTARARDAEAAADRDRAQLSSIMAQAQIEVAAARAAAAEKSAALTHALTFGCDVLFGALEVRVDALTLLTRYSGELLAECAKVFVTSGVANAKAAQWKEKVRTVMQRDAAQIDALQRDAKAHEAQMQGVMTALQAIHGDRGELHRAIQQGEVARVAVHSRDGRGHDAPDPQQQ
jgi:chromosome segregation ATPase